MELSTYRKMGKLYRALTDRNHPNGANQAQLANAQKWPMKEITVEISLAHKLRTITPRIDRLCAQVLADMSLEDVTGSQKAATMQQQSEFSAGYMMGWESLDVTPENVRKARNAAGLSIRQLAEKVGVSPSTITRVEAGTISPRAETLQKIADALGVKMSDLWPE